MGWQIVKNPKTEKYQVFSSVVDAFIFEEEVTREELTEFWKEEFGRQGEYNFTRILNDLDKDRNPYNQFTMTWEEAVMWSDHQTKHHYKNPTPSTCGICKDNQKDQE